MGTMNFPTSPTNGDVYESWTYDGVRGLWDLTGASAAAGGIDSAAVISIIDADYITSRQHHLFRSAAAPSSPHEGELWLNTTTDVVFIYNGTTWDDFPITEAGAVSIGAGTTNHAASRWNNTSSVWEETTNVILTDSGVGIGIASPTEKLHVDGNILASGDVTAFSDIAYKEEINPINDALNKVSMIGGYTFKRVGQDDRKYTGVLAQELKQVLPEAVHGEEGSLHVAYGNIVGLLVEAIKDLKKEVEDLKK